MNKANFRPNVVISKQLSSVRDSHTLISSDSVNSSGFCVVLENFDSCKTLMHT